MVYYYPKCPKCNKGIMMSTGRHIKFKTGTGEIFKCNKCGFEQKNQTTLFL